MDAVASAAPVPRPQGPGAHPPGRWTAFEHQRSTPDSASTQPVRVL